MIANDKWPANGPFSREIDLEGSKADPLRLAKKPGGVHSPRVQKKKFEWGGLGLFLLSLFC